MRPKLLGDLFGGAGGAAEGYHRAGFDVVGVDTDANALRRYPYESINADWLAGARQLLETRDVAAWHASPPCQTYSQSRYAHGITHPELVEPVRDFLQSTCLPYVIENVPGAPLVNPVQLCGTMFDLHVEDDDGVTLFLRRHRLFESNTFLYPAGQCGCAELKRRGWYCGGVYGGNGGLSRDHMQNVRHGGYTPRKAKREALMGINWMTQDQLSQSIPPAYTEWIGAQLLHALDAVA